MHALSASPAGEDDLRPLGPGELENLVAAFDEAYTAFVEGFETLPSESQMLAIQAVDTKLTALVRAHDADLWTTAAWRSGSDWIEVRSLVDSAVAAFDWTTGETPGAGIP